MFLYTTTPDIIHITWQIELYCGAQAAADTLTATAAPRSHFTGRMRARNLLHLKAGSAPLLFSGWKGTRLNDFAWHSVLCRHRRRRKRANTVPPIATTETPTPGLLSTDRRLVVLVNCWVRHRLWRVRNLIRSEVFKTLVGKLSFCIDRLRVVCLPSKQLEEAKVFRRSNITAWLAAIFYTITCPSRGRVYWRPEVVESEFWPCVLYPSHISHYKQHAYDSNVLHCEARVPVVMRRGLGSHISHFLIAVQARVACGGVDWNVWYARNPPPNLKCGAVWVPWLC